MGLRPDVRWATGLGRFSNFEDGSLTLLTCASRTPSVLAVWLVSFTRRFGEPSLPRSRALRSCHRQPKNTIATNSSRSGICIFISFRLEMYLIFMIQFSSRTWVPLPAFPLNIVSCNAIRQATDRKIGTAGQDNTHRQRLSRIKTPKNNELADPVNNYYGHENETHPPPSYISPLAA